VASGEWVGQRCSKGSQYPNLTKNIITPTGALVLWFFQIIKFLEEAMLLNLYREYQAKKFQIWREKQSKQNRPLHPFFLGFLKSNVLLFPAGGSKYFLTLHPGICYKMSRCI